MAYAGIERGAKFSAAAIEAALDTKVSLTGDETIDGKKTFKVSPVVPEKDAAAGNNPTAIATEAQVYKALETSKKHIDDLLSSKVGLSGAEEISDTKTFTTSPVVPGKNTVANSANSTVIATEAQVYKTLMCWHD
jgi:hypothetical protein